MTKNTIIRDTDPEWFYRDHMRAACAGSGEIYKFMTVRMQPTNRISAHKHVYHTVLYYPELAEPVMVTPQPGTMLYLPPGTTHEVPPVKRERISIAMLVKVSK